MSYLDVKVLRRFTQKLANATMGAETWATPGAGTTQIGQPPDAPAPDAAATTRPSVPDSAHITAAPTLLERLNLGHDQLKGRLGDHGKYLPDLQTLGYGAGGALAGGAGAMALAQLLRSEEEKKKGPSLLAGAGGALAGGIGLPLLMQYLAGGKAAPVAGLDATTMGTKPITLNTNPGLKG